MQIYNRKGFNKNIYIAANEITERDATNYIKHSFNFLGAAVEEKDFIGFCSFEVKC